MAWLQLLLLMIVTSTVAGCELAEGIFKAGAWVGAIVVILLIATAGVLVAKIRG
jgi:hypothetical protein